jgi:hypothetical protein
MFQSSHSHSDEVDRFTDLCGCSKAPVANKTKSKTQAAATFCCSDGVRPHFTSERHLPASFVTAVATVATPRNNVLQQAGVGQLAKSASVTREKFVGPNRFALVARG